MMMAQETRMDMWTPFKDLQTFVEDVVSKPVHGVIKTMEEMLRNHKQNFLTLLKNPPKNAEHREEIRKALAEGTPLPGLRRQLLSKEIVDETIIISDMYELNEYMAFDLLCTAQQQMPHHPGLPRGLVAVLLYYDGRKSLVYALKALVQARKGISWVVNASEDLVRYITSFTKELMDQGVFCDIIDLLETMDLTKELNLLNQNRAIGGPRHHRQIVELYQSIRQGLADIIFCWAAQCGLPKKPTFKLINFLECLKLEEDASGNIDNISVTTQMALLYALDLSVLHSKEDGEEVVKSLPLFAESDFLQALMKKFPPMKKTWDTPGLQGLTYLAWALTLASLRMAPASLHSLDISDEDDLLVDTANELNVFDFMQRSFLRNQLIYSEEFFVRRLHTLVTDFIVYMPMKVKEMKSRSDESARTIQAYMQEGLEAPQALSHHFEHLLLTVEQLYKDDSLKLELVLQYWCPMETLTSERFLYRSPPRQVALFKFIRLGGDVLPPAVFVPYMKMLRSLASSPRAARNAFNFLKQNGNGSATVSWAHFFKSLESYYSNLRQELPPTTDTVYQPRSFPRGILPQEIQGLQAVLGVVRAVAENDPVSRMALSDNPQWSPMTVMLGLVACAVPIPLKAELLLTLAALARSAGPATALWYSLEASQILTTVPSTSSYQPRGVQTELEEIESRNEEFPLTRALLHLLDVLTDVPIPRLLGVECRSPGFDPYLNFIVNSVFLRFNTRSYKNPEEKWDVAQKCLRLLKKFLAQYNPDIMDFTAQRVQLQSGGTAQVNPVPGYHIMVNLNTKTELLRLVLHLVNEGANLLDSCSQVAGQAALEESMLNCLLLLQHALALQGHFSELLARSGSSLLLTGLRRLLLDVNPRSGNPDHLLNVAKYITYSSALPHHALAAVRILLAVSWTPSAQAHLLSLFTSSPELTMEIRHGIVECLEADEDEILPGQEDLDGGSVQSSTKEAIFKLLQQCLHYSSPNISHYLFGFDLKKVDRTVFQQPGVLGFPRTCLHSLLSILDKSLGDRLKSYASLPRGQLLESCYCMLYLLCSDVKTSGPVLRFLRSCGDFLLRHLAHLPFHSDNKTSDLLQMSWLLKVVAVELKATARNDQMSSLANLVELLTHEQGDTFEDPDNREAFAEDKDENLSRFLSRKRNLDPSKVKKQRVLLALLNQLDFHVASIPQPEWEFFVPKQLAELSSKCEVTGARGQSTQIVDVKKLHKMILEELAVIQSSTSAAQRSLVLSEIEKVLKFTIQQNNQRAHCHATVCYMDAWRQVAEILFCVCPRRVLPEDVRLGLLVDCLHVLLKKVLSHQVIPNLAALSSGVILLLSVALHHCLVACQEQELATVSANSAISGTPSRTAPNLAIPGRPGIFDIVLSNILEWIINSGVASQKLRSNLYGALLMFVRMTCRDPYQRRHEEQTLTYQSSMSNSLFVSRLDASEIRAAPADTSMRRQACLEIIMGFGEGLIDVLCHDCTGGHDVCKMLALSCLGLLIEFDPHTSWISHLSSRGYLRHIVDSLLESDDKLTAMLGINPHTLSPLYVYESKMAMLCRIAASHTGAELLLELGAFGCLANMSVFDKHPDFRPNLVVSDISFIPTARSRYQQILFPALDLCNAVLTTLGPDNQACSIQIQHFLFSHYEMLSIILRCVSPVMQIKFLKELARITGIIARVSNHVVDENIDFDDVKMSTNYTAHVQSWMLELMRHFRLSESIVRELRGPPPSSITASATDNYSNTTSSSESRREDSVLQFLQVACNLVLFARNVVAGKGLDRKIRTPLFTPHLEEFFSESGKKEMEEKEVVCPPLGLVVEQLVQCVAYHQREKANLDVLQHKKMSLGSVNYSLDSSEIMLDSTREALHSEECHASASQALDEQIERKSLELAHCSFLVDNCLYLIWCHLSHFAEEASGRKENIGLLSFSKPVTLSPKVPMKISKQDISALKQGLVSTFNDRFSKQLMETQQEKSAIDKGFVEALLRRIKRLIQFTRVDLKS